MKETKCVGRLKFLFNIVDDNNIEIFDYKFMTNYPFKSGGYYYFQHEASFDYSADDFVKDYKQFSKLKKDTLYEMQGDVNFESKEFFNGEMTEYDENYWLTNEEVYELDWKNFEEEGFGLNTDLINYGETTPPVKEN
jgi:hypothetical protein